MVEVIVVVVIVVVVVVVVVVVDITEKPRTQKTARQKMKPSYTCASPSIPTEKKE